MSRTVRVVLAVVLAGALAACGDREPLVLPPRPSTTPTTIAGSPPDAGTSQPSVAAPASPGTPAPTSARWMAATGNLEGLSSECGNMSYVSARPDRDMLIAGIAQRGLWASTDGGTTWQQLGTGAGSDEIVNRTSAVVYDPANPNVFWESGIYNAGGVYRTDDDGATFQQLGNVTHSDLVAVDLDDPQRRTLLSGTHELPELFRSTDAGQSWTNVAVNLPPDIGFAISPVVIDAQTHLLGTRSGAGAGVFRTSDGGATWDKVFEGGVSSHPLAASDGARYWVLEGGGGVIKSVDDGATWTVVPGRIDASPSLVELPNGMLAAIAGEHISVSSNRGQTWTPIGPEMPYSPTGFTYSPHQQAFFIWRFDCDFTTDNPVAPDAIMRLDFDAAA